jgi:hypothetical protein
MSDLDVQILDGEVFKLPKNYKLNEIRGKGSYALVASGVDLNTNKPIAVKKNYRVFPTLDKDGKPISESRSETVQKRILREIKVKTNKFLNSKDSQPHQRTWEYYSIN